MVPLAGSSSDGDHPVLICSVHTECVPLREMLSLLLARRHIEHRAFLDLDALLDFLADGSDRTGASRIAVMVGPSLSVAEVARIDATLHALAQPLALVVFHDVLEDDPNAWAHARTEPSLRSPIPPRLAEVLRVIEGRPT